MEILDQALEYLDRGWGVLPISPTEKTPLPKWGHFVDTLTLPTEQEVIKWWTEWPDAQLAIITGPLSGLVVVDCDNEEARQSAEKLGLTSTPVVVKTRKGWHYYFQYPRNERWVKNRVGRADGDGAEWPAVGGLDLRGSKGYVLAPPSKNYSWQIMQGADWDDLPVYSAPKTLVRPQASNVVDFNEFKFEGMSLEHVSIHQSIWKSTADLVTKHGRLAEGGGNARDDRLWKCISEAAAQGLRGSELVSNATDFMDQFYSTPISIKKVEQMCQRVEGMEAKNHPDRLEPEKEEEEQKKLRGITTRDIQRLEDEAGEVRYFVEPFIPTSGTICQVHGYSGHGKSMFTRHLLYSAAAGNDRFGPFELHDVPRVLYCDYENSRTNVTKFLKRCMSSFGDAGDRFTIFAPFDEEDEMNLRTQEGRALLQRWIAYTRPDIIVIDTIRSAFPGLEENSSEEWSGINQLCLKLRNVGITVILVHHSNKPSESTGSSGREAGSSNQLTVLETQIKITQVFADKATAQAKAGLYDGDLFDIPMSALSSPPIITNDERIEVCTELRYGKVREYTDMHEPVMYLGFSGHKETEDLRIVSKQTPKQLACTLAREWVDADGVTRAALSDMEICTSSKVNKPLSVVKEWTAPIRAMDHGARIAAMK
jgi:hypothetical protein